MFSRGASVLGKTTQPLIILRPFQTEGGLTVFNFALYFNPIETKKLKMLLQYHISKSDSDINLVPK